jgi:glucosamine kinase
MNETLPANIRKKFIHRYDADRKTLLEKVYRQKQPALFLKLVQRFLPGEQRRCLS